MSHEKRNRKAPDFDRIDDIPTTRIERLKAIWVLIERGEEKHGGYNLQQLISKISVRWGMKRKTLSDYFEGLERAGFTYVDDKLKVRIREEYD